MTDYLASVIARSRDTVGAVRPRVGSLFESPQVIVDATGDGQGEGPAPHEPAPHAWTAAPALGRTAAPPPTPPGGEPAAGPSPPPPDAAWPAPPRAADAPAGTKHPATGTGDRAGRTARAEERPGPGARRRAAAVAATPTAPGVRARRRADTARPARQAAVSRPSVEPAPPAEPGRAGRRTPAGTSRRSRLPASGDAASTAGSAEAPSGAVAAGAAPVEPPAAATVRPSPATSARMGATAVAAVATRPGATPARAHDELIAVAPSPRRRLGAWVEPVTWPVAPDPAGDTEAGVEDEPAPAVQVTIGRVEVRASVPAPAVSPARPGPSPAMTLDDYLRRRTSRRGR